MDRVRSEIEQNKDLSESLKMTLLEIYNEYCESSNDVGVNSELKAKVDNVLEKMFKNAFGYNLPMTFIESSIGKFLLKIKLEAESSNEVMYGASECAILSGKSRAMINKYFKNGSIVGKKIAGRYSVQEEEVIRFLTNVGHHPITLSEAQYRIKHLKNLLNKGYNLEEIKNEFSYDKSWMNEKKRNRKYIPDEK